MAKPIVNLYTPEKKAKDITEFLSWVRETLDAGESILASLSKNSPNNMAICESLLLTLRAEYNTCIEHPSVEDAINMFRLSHLLVRINQQCNPSSDSLNGLVEQLYYLDDKLAYLREEAN